MKEIVLHSCEPDISVLAIMLADNSLFSGKNGVKKSHALRVQYERHMRFHAQEAKRTTELSEEIFEAPRIAVTE